MSVITVNNTIQKYHTQAFKFGFLFALVTSGLYLQAHTISIYSIYWMFCFQMPILALFSTFYSMHISPCMHIFPNKKICEENLQVLLGPMDQVHDPIAAEHMETVACGQRTTETENQKKQCKHDSKNRRAHVIQSPKGALARIERKKRHGPVLFAPGSQTNFAEHPNVQKHCTGNILAERLSPLCKYHLLKFKNHACRFGIIQCASRVYVLQEPAQMLESFTRNSKGNGEV